MFKKLSCLLLGAAPLAATAQTDDCAAPVLKLLRNGQEIPATGSAPAPRVTLQVTAAPDCPGPATYRFRWAEVTLIRNGRPVLPTFRVTQPQADLKALMSAAQPGDHVYVFIPYANLATVGADGKLQLYRATRPAQPKPRQLDLTTDESRGINFTWKLVRE